MPRKATIDRESAVQFAEPIQKLTRDIKAAAVRLGIDEARFLVDTYYTMQDNRKRADNQIRALGEANEPNDVLKWMSDGWSTLETGVKGVLGSFSDQYLLGQWMKSICGVGPVISAGLICHVDWTVPSVGNIYSFAGLVSSRKWEKGQKRPWNARLKTLCYLIGECFVKVRNNEKDFYGKVFAERKEFEQARNDRGDNAERCKLILAEKKWRDGTDTKKHLLAGHLSPAHIHAMARRFAVKMFLSHCHTIGYFIEQGRLPVIPYVFREGLHKDYVAPPNIGMIEGLAEAIKRDWNLPLLNQYRAG